MVDQLETLGAGGVPAGCSASEVGIEAGFMKLLMHHMCCNVDETQYAPLLLDWRKLARRETRIANRCVVLVVFGDKSGVVIWQ